MRYPADGIPFEIDSKTIGMLYRAVQGERLGDNERRRARDAVDYICAATLIVPPEEEEE